MAQTTSIKHKGWKWSTADESNPTLVLVVDDTSKAVHIADASDASADWSVSADSYPSLYIHTAGSNVAGDYVKIWHDDTDANIACYNATALNFLIDTTAYLEMTTSALAPSTTNVMALGTASLNFTDIYLDSGGILYCDGSNAILTMTSSALTITPATTFSSTLAITNLTTCSGGLTVVGTLTLPAGSIEHADLANNCVITNNIWPQSVTGDKIDVNQIDSDHYVDGSIDTEHLADGIITHAKLGDDCVITNNIWPQSVTEAELADDAVEAKHMSNNAIETMAIANNAVTATKIDVPGLHGQSGNVAPEHIDESMLADGAVTHAKLADRCVITNNIWPQSVTSAETAGPSFGPSGVTSITVVNGLITAIS